MSDVSRTSKQQFECRPENETLLLQAILAWFENHPNADVHVGGHELLAQYRRALTAMIERRAVETECKRDARGFPLSSHGIAIEARCAACGCPLITQGEEDWFTHDCDCMHRPAHAAAGHPGSGADSARVNEGPNPSGPASSVKTTCSGDTP
jgi:hypothetical protein